MGWNNGAGVMVWMEPGQQLGVMETGQWTWGQWGWADALGWWVEVVELMQWYMQANLCQGEEVPGPRSGAAAGEGERQSGVS